MKSNLHHQKEHKMYSDDELRDAIRHFQASIDRLLIDIAIALQPWEKTVQSAMTTAFAPFFKRLRDNYPEAFDEDGALRDNWLEIVRVRGMEG